MFILLTSVTSVTVNYKYHIWWLLPVTGSHDTFRYKASLHLEGLCILFLVRTTQYSACIRQSCAVWRCIWKNDSLSFRIHKAPSISPPKVSQQQCQWHKYEIFPYLSKTASWAPRWKLSQGIWKLWHNTALINWNMFTPQLIGSTWSYQVMLLNDIQMHNCDQL